LKSFHTSKRSRFSDSGDALPNPNPITGTGPTLAPIANSDFLDDREFKGTWTYYATGAGIFGTPVTLMLLSGQSAIAQPQTYDFRIAPASP